LEEKTVGKKLNMCIIFLSNKFMDNENAFLKMYCVQQYCNVDVEGPAIYYFNNETTDDLEEEVVVEVVEEDEEERTT
jgi:hypothetical protein